ncbi:MAG: hypothetical protein ACJ79S_06320 [Gemmatimonadaceae bacterium]
MTIQLVDPDHNIFPGQVVTQTFTVPNYGGAEAHSRELHARPASPE